MWGVCRASVDPCVGRVWGVWEGVCRASVDPCVGCVRGRVWGVCRPVCGVCARACERFVHNIV